MSEESATRRPSSPRLTRFVSSRWWPLFSTVGPMFIGTIGVIWMGQQASNGRHQVLALKAEQEHLRREKEEAEAQNAALRSERDTIQANLDAKKNQLADLQQQVAIVTSQRDLIVATGAPATEVSVTQVLAAMAGRPARERALALHRRGGELTRLNEPKRAADFFNAALKEDPAFAPAMLELGFQASRRGDYKEAERLYLAAAAAAKTADPEHEGYALLHLTSLYLLRGRLDDARRAGEQLRNAPRRPAQADGVLRQLDERLLNPQEK